MLRSILIAAAMLCALPTLSHARPVLHPACNTFGMPCEVMLFSSTSFEAGEINKPRAQARRAVDRDLARKRASSRAVVRPVSESAMGLVERARAYLGQTARQVGVRTTLWCSAFLRHLTGATGVDDRAISWLAKRRIGKQVGAIAVMRHHVGLVSGFDRNGNPILISGNHSRRVGEGAYSARRVLAYVSL